MKKVLDEVFTDQQGEVLLQEKKLGPFTYRYAYARSADSRSEDEAGQDYLMFRCAEDSFVFAVCDGVGLSFNGDMAAKFLGKKLCEWLESERIDAGLDQCDLQHELTQFLNSLIPEASLMINRFEIDSQIQGFHREVLEEKREHGSETTYICGRIDISHDPSRENRLLLAWQGDSRLRMWGEEGEQTHLLGNRFLTKQRWSTSKGPVGGEPNVFVTRLSNDGVLNKLLIYTDGLSELDRLSYSPTSEKLHDHIQLANEKPGSDDLSLMEIGWNLESLLNEEAKHHSLRLMFQKRRKDV
ncbi:serine/threonine protein phosphatase PrpC [Bacillus fengqiuensis]|nr:serine/threonine protein phosphatase PrpC [Bacillus fengqiuensis]